MSSAHEVISAFLDDEPFDLQTLEIALADPAGRALLIDLLALRRIVQPIEALSIAGAPGRVRRSVWRVAAAAAALVVALAGGYVLGERAAETTSSEAPPPTRVVQAVPFLPAGGVQ